MRFLIDADVRAPKPPEWTLESGDLPGDGED